MISAQRRGLDFYTDKKWSIGLKREKPIAHGRKWFGITLCLGRWRVSTLSKDVREILRDQEH